jgi:5-methylcytosine-specific restriction enzyme A
MLRRSRLRAKTGLQRRSPLRTSRKKKTGRRDTGPDRATRDLVAERDAGCVNCGIGPYGLQVHHRKPRRMGGRTDPRINAPSNLISLCQACHTWVELRRTEALDMGLLVRENDDPRKVPVPHAELGLVFLDDAGGWSPAPHINEEN